MLKRAFYNLIDSFKPVEGEVLHCYQNKMPDTVDVAVHSDKDGRLWAEIVLEAEDKLFTEAKNRAELEEMVNDAVATFYGVPYRYARYILLNKRYSDPERKNKKALRTA